MAHRIVYPKRARRRDANFLRLFVALHYDTDLQQRFKKKPVAVMQAYGLTVAEQQLVKSGNLNDMERYMRDKLAVLTRPTAPAAIPWPWPRREGFDDLTYDPGADIDPQRKG